jgi:hypothetical protein
MQNRHDKIDRHTMGFQLNEALLAVIALLRDLEAGKYRRGPDEWGLAVSLTFIVDHLCLAWHQRWMGPDEVMKESQEERDLRAVSVPNWGGRFKLVDIAHVHAGIDSSVRRRGTLNASTIGTYLRAAEVALRDLAAKIAAGDLDYCETESLGNGFEPILRNICLAWHLRYLSPTEVSSLDPMTIQDLAGWLPPWQWNTRVVSMEEAPTGGAVASE